MSIFGCLTFKETCVFVVGCSVSYEYTKIIVAKNRHNRQKIGKNHAVENQGWELTLSAGSSW